MIVGLVLMTIAFCVLSVFFTIKHCAATETRFLLGELKNHVYRLQDQLMSTREAVGEVASAVNSNGVDAQLKARLDENIILAKKVEHLEQRVSELSLKKTYEAVSGSAFG